MQPASTYTVTGAAWRHPEAAGWHFVTLSEEIADEIRAHAGAHLPFGSLPVRATLGRPLGRHRCSRTRSQSAYLVPVKTAVR